MTSWGSDEETIRFRPPVDPWPEARDGWTEEFPTTPAPAPGRRRVYGYVYELITGNPQDGPHPYAGQTTTTIHQRVHGRGGHTSPASIAKDPWKARILPGSAGYRCLKRIYSTGDPEADQIRLDLAEWIAIDELKTTHNEQRPIRHAGDRPSRPRPRAVGRPVPRRTRRPFPFRAILFLALTAVLTYLAARVLVAMQLPWPAVPWIGAPVFGLWLGWATFWRLHRGVRKLAPRRRRR